jgi:MFS family permease
MKRVWPVTALLTICFTLSYTDRHILSLLVEPVKASLQLSDTQLGLVQGLSFSIFYVLASMPLARLSDTGHRPRIMSGCIVVWCTMTALCGAVANFWHLMLARIGVAASEAGLPPAALTMMADLNDAKRLARANSIFMLAPYLGGGLALMAGGKLYAWVQDWDTQAMFGSQVEPWRLVFVLVGLPGLVAAAAVLFLDEPRRNRPASPRQPSFTELGRFLRREWRFNTCYMLTMAMMVLMLNATVSWMPAILMRSFGVDARSAGMLFGPTFLVAGITGTITAGLVIGRSSANTLERIFRYKRACVWIALPALLATPFAPSIDMQLALIALVLLCLASINSLSSMPFLLVVPIHIRAQALAFLALVTALVGTGLGPMLVGIVSDLATNTANPLRFALTSVCVTAALLAIGMLQWLVPRAARIAQEAERENRVLCASSPAS